MKFTEDQPPRCAQEGSGDSLGRFGVSTRSGERDSWHRGRGRLGPKNPHRCRRGRIRSQVPVAPAPQLYGDWGQRPATRSAQAPPGAISLRRGVRFHGNHAQGGPGPGCPGHIHRGTQPRETCQDGDGTRSGRDLRRPSLFNPGGGSTTQAGEEGDRPQIYDGRDQLLPPLLYRGARTAGDRSLRRAFLQRGRILSSPYRPPGFAALVP